MVNVLSEEHRIIGFDKRGQGLSDPITENPDLDERRAARPVRTSPPWDLIQAASTEHCCLLWAFLSELCHKVITIHIHVGNL